MKFTLSPSRAYLLGLWKGRRTKEGIGVEGHAEVCEVFIKLCLDEKIAQADKIQLRDGEVPGAKKCFFYNSALRAWLDGEMKKRDERFRFRNDFAAGYFAGAFDARGGFVPVGGKEIPYFFGDSVDEMVLLRLGFRARRERGKVAVFSGDFYGWI